MRWLTSGVIASFGGGMLLHRWNAQGLLPKVKIPFWFLAMAICALAAIPVSFAFVAGPLAIAIAMPLVLIAGISARAGKDGVFQRWLGDISYFFVHPALAYPAGHCSQGEGSGAT